MGIKQVFENIRDIPYRIPLAVNEPDHCCNGKMKMFKAWLDQNGYKSRYRVCQFRWSDLNLPAEVMDVEHEDNSIHPLSQG